MIKITVEKAASTFKVHTKTIREWIREGMPVAREGDKGAGNGALIDMVRAVDWLRRKREQPPPVWADFFADQPDMPPNPLRSLIELYADDMPWTVSWGLLCWLRDTKGKNTQPDWQVAGLTEKQAERVVWDVFAWILTFLADYKVNVYEKKRLAPVAGGADLDDLATHWFCGDIRSEWKDEVQIPPDILAFMPDDYRERYSKMFKRTKKPKD